MTAVDLHPYPPAIADELPLPAAPEPRPIPERKLCLVDYHLKGPVVPVPSRAADEMAGHVHGWLYRLQGQDPDERRPCDAEQQTAPFAAWLIGDGHRSRRPGQQSIRVCWYGQDAMQRATAALAANQTAIIGAQPFALAGISPVSREPITAASILERQEDAQIVRLHAISPVAFRNHARWHCSLDGQTVLGSCISRWLRLWPATLPEGFEGVHLGAVDRARYLAWLGYISISACELRTEMTRRSERMATMALRGWVEYDLTGLDNPNRRRMVVALLRGAEVFGLGSRCAYGLGAVSLEILR